VVRDVRLVVNPDAGRGWAAAQASAVAEVMRTQGWTVEVCHATAGQLERLASAVDPHVLVCSLGGEGTHARVASGAYVAGALFTPLPGGRGNDLVRAVGLPRHPVAAAQRLLHVQERRIDLGDVGGAPFLGVVSIGASARANALANSSPMTGARAYHVAAARMALNARPSTYRLDLDGEVLEVCAYEVAIGLSGRYGGGMRICPQAELDDGLLDVTIITGPRSTFPRVLTNMFNGRLGSVRGVLMLRARTVHVEGEGPVFADGDRIGDLPITATVSPRALRLLA